MHVRWARRRIACGGPGKWSKWVEWRAHPDRVCYALDATLAQAYRQDGAPRQRHICTLGHIDEEGRDAPAGRYAFWWTARHALDGVDLPAGQRATVEAKLAERVTPIGPEPFADRAEWARLALLAPDAAAAVLEALTLPQNEARHRWGLLTELDRLHEARRIVRESRAESDLHGMAMSG